MELINEIGQKSKLLDSAVRELGIRGRAYAQAEQDYRIALAEKIISERDKGTPATLCSDIWRGDRRIAKLRLERAVAVVVYTYAMEAIDSLKLQ